MMAIGRRRVRPDAAARKRHDRRRGPPFRNAGRRRPGNGGSMSSEPQWLSRGQILEQFGIDAQLLSRITVREKRAGKPVASFCRTGKTTRNGARWEYHRDWVAEYVAEANANARQGFFIDDGGRKWYGVQAIKDAWGFTLNQLTHWHYQGCPWLGGRKTRRQTRPCRRADGCFRNRVFYLKDELNDIAAAQGAKDAPAQWATCEEALDDYGYSRKTLCKWAHQGKLRSTKMFRIDAAGRPANRTVFSRMDLDRITTTGADDDKRDWLTYKEADDLFGFKLTALLRWTKDGACLYLPRQKLGSRRTSERIADGRIVPIRRFSRKDLDVIADKLRGPDNTTPHEDAEGIWMPLCEAARRTGIAEQVLSYYRRHPGQTGSRSKARRGGRSLLPDRALRWKVIRRRGKNTPRGKLIVVHWGDLQRIVAARSGRSLPPDAGQTTVKPRRHAGGRSTTRDNVREYCCTRVANGDKLELILDSATKQFGSDAPKSTGQVVEDAKRHAKKFHLPCPLQARRAKTTRKQAVSNLV
jgi:hypothetical protein